MLQARGIADDRGDGTYVIRYSTAHLVPGKYLLHVDLVQSISKGRRGFAGGGGLTARYFTNGGLSGAPSVLREEIGPLACVVAINLCLIYILGTTGMTGVLENLSLALPTTSLSAGVVLEWLYNIAKPVSKLVLCRWPIAHHRNARVTSNCTL